jgi:hypothetical protein
MHASPIRIPEILSAVIPFKASVPAHSSEVPSTFCRTLRSAIALPWIKGAGSSTGGKLQAIPKPTSNDTAPDDKGSFTKSPPNAAKRQEDVPPESAMSREQGVDWRQGVTGKGDISEHAVATAVSSGLKRDPKTQAHVASEGMPQSESQNPSIQDTAQTPPLTAAPVAAGQAGVSQIPAGPVQKPTEESSGAGLRLVPPVKPGQSVIDESGKDTTATPAPVSSGNAAALAGRQTAESATHNPAGSHNAEPVLAATSRVSLGDHTIAGAVSPANGGTHAPAAGTATIAVPTAVPTHSAVPLVNARADVEAPVLTSGVRGTAPQVLASSPARLDVGVFDGTHGWLRIRAELGTSGTLNASLTATASAHESLKAVLPEMANYLGAELVAVNRIAIHRFGEHANPLPTATGNPQHGDAKDNGPTGQHSREDAGDPDGSSATVDPQGDSFVFASTDQGIRQWAASAPGLNDWLGGFSSTAIRSGSWLSVCA